MVIDVMTRPVLILAVPGLFECSHGSRVMKALEFPLSARLPQHRKKRRRVFNLDRSEHLKPMSSVKRNVRRFVDSR